MRASSRTLADLGITGIDLNATASSGTIDGQQLLAEGTFTYANGADRQLRHGCSRPGFSHHGQRDEQD